MFTSVRLLYGVIGLGSLVIAIGIIRGEAHIHQFFELRQSRDLLKETINNIQNANQNLKSEINKIKNSPIYAKRLLKDTYHELEENEELIFLEDE
jgi:AAA+ ATPase superfamily predicted ATPase